MAWAGLWRVRRTIRGSRKKKKQKKEGPAFRASQATKV